MIFTGLRQTAARYMIAGIISGLIIFSALVAGKYERNLRETMQRFELIEKNAVKIRQANVNMDMTMDGIDRMLPPNYYSTSNKEYLLLALDTLKANIKDAEIALTGAGTGFEEKAGELSLSVNIKIPVKDYVLLVNQIGELQALRFPNFYIKSIILETSVANASPALQQSAIICSIAGYLGIPSEKKKEGRKHG